MSLATACAPLIAAELGRRRDAVREVRRSFRMGIAARRDGGGAGRDRAAERRATVPARGAGSARGGAGGRLPRHPVPRAAAVDLRRGDAHRRRRAGRPGWALGVTAMAVALGLLFNWLLVFGNLGFPALGLEGSAIASVLTVVAMMIAYVAILVLDPKLRRYRLFGRWWRSEWSRFGEMLRIGVPIALDRHAGGGGRSAARRCSWASSA
ncbi:hypothetical protein AB5I41_28160 [Sphingomonas sp. MMS24-JH45]